MNKYTNIDSAVNKIGVKLNALNPLRADDNKQLIQKSNNEIIIGSISKRLSIKTIYSKTMDTINTVKTHVIMYNFPVYENTGIEKINSPKNR